MKKTFLMMMVLLGAGLGLSGHGLDLQVEIRPPLVVTRAFYEGGIPLAFGLVTVNNPRGEEFQNGRTDRLGRFVFYPDQQGTWTVIVDDEMGHLRRTQVDLSELSGQSAAAVPVEKKEYSFWLKLLFGLGLILLLSAGLYFWKRHLEARLH